MYISIITVFPELYKTFFSTSLIGKAVEKQYVSFNLVKLSDLCQPKERIDEPICGPGTGMLIKPQIIEIAIDSCEKKFGKGFKIFFSPQGAKLNQQILQKLADQYNTESTNNISSPKQEKKVPHFILICCRYEGIDERIEQYYADLTISIGDYIVMGGDLPAQVFLEGFLRLLPNIVGKTQSIKEESFSGPLLDYPTYGLPVEWKGLKIPAVVLSGNHEEIRKWRHLQAAKKTLFNRFDWFASSQPTQEDIALAHTLIPPHYTALFHSQIEIKGGRIGHSSIASLDIHDIARSCKTYGIKLFFIITQLKDQRNIMDTFLSFWHSKEGKEYNQSRYDAIAQVNPASNIDQVIAKIRKLEGTEPLIIATSAKNRLNVPKIDYSSQSFVWQHKKPILFIFGTGQGLSDELLDKADFLLTPLKGMSDYNHLSVRSAAAIILDRWLGLHAKMSVPIDRNNK